MEYLYIVPIPIISLDGKTRVQHSGGTVVADRKGIARWWAVGSWDNLNVKKWDIDNIPLE